MYQMLAPDMAARMPRTDLDNEADMMHTALFSA